MSLKGNWRYDTCFNIMILLISRIFWTLEGTCTVLHKHTICSYYVGYIVYIFQRIFNENILAIILSEKFVRSIAIHTSTCPWLYAQFKLTTWTVHCLVILKTKLVPERDQRLRLLLLFNEMYLSYELACRIEVLIMTE